MEFVRLENQTHLHSHYKTLQSWNQSDVPENRAGRCINLELLTTQHSYFAFLADPGTQQDPSDTLIVSLGGSRSRKLCVTRAMSLMGTR